MPSPLRILNVAQTYYPFLDEGGRPWKVAAMSKALIAAGHQVAVLTADLGLDAAFAKVGVDWPARRVRRAWGWEYDHEGIEAHYLDVLWRYRVVTISPGVVPFCRAHLRRFDVVHIFGLYDLLGAAVAAFCRHTAIPYVVEPMGMVQPIVRSMRKKRVYHALLGGRLLERAARVVATSEQESAELVDAGVRSSNVMVRRNGVDLSAFARLPPRGRFRASIGAREDDFLLLFLGRISKKKGLDLLVRGMKDLDARVRLAVVGPDDGDGCVQEILDVAKQCGLRDRVVVEKPRYDEAKLEAMVDADLFVLPSQNENFGNAVIESLACGVPALVTDRCGVASIVKEGAAGVVVAYDERAIVDGVKSVLGDPVRLAAMRANARPVASRLSWDNPVRRMVDLYTELRADVAARP